MIRFIVFAALAAAGYYLTRNWYVVGAVVAAYIIYSLVANSMSASRDRRRADTLLHQKLSDAEKAHMTAVADHQRVMHEHKAQFDPELRKKI